MDDVYTERTTSAARQATVPSGRRDAVLDGDILANVVAELRNRLERL